MNIITPTEYSLLTGEEITGYDASRVDALIDAISTDISNYTGRLFEHTAIVNRRLTAQVDHATSELVLQLPFPPIVSIQALRRWVIGTTIDVNIDLIDLDEINGILRVPYVFIVTQQPSPMPVRVDYTAGYTAPSTNVKLACALLVQEALMMADLAAEGQQLSALSGFRVGDYAESYAVLKGVAQSMAADQLGLGTPLSTRAVQLLMKIKRGGVVFI